jgi:hypothetical protein
MPGQRVARISQVGGVRGDPRDRVGILGAIGRGLLFFSGGAYVPLIRLTLKNGWRYAPGRLSQVL